MKELADHHDAELLLRLYELRREEKLRVARDWMATKFHAASLEEMNKLCPPGSKESEYFRMAVSYWDMAASIVNRGLINDELFFENNTELWLIWTKVKPIAAERRAAFKNPLSWQNLETVAEKYEKWMEHRAPGALEAFRQRIKKAVPSDK